MHRIHQRIFSTWLAVLLLCGVAADVSAQMLAESYFPVNYGWEWRFIQSDALGTRVVDKSVRPEKKSVLGTETFVIETVGGPAAGLDFYTSDGLGVQFHQTFNGQSGAIFSPPIQVLPDELEAGDSFSSEGLALTTGGLALPYSTYGTLSGPFQVAVPYGTFDAMLLQSTTTIFGFSSTDHLYFAENVGVVRYVTDVGGVNRLSELTALTVPEPNFLLGTVLGAGFLGGLLRRRSCG